MHPCRTESWPKADQFKPMQDKKLHRHLRSETANRSSLPENRQKKRRVYSSDNWRPKDFRNMENEFMKRGYLLPAGCKNLADAMKLPKEVTKVQTSKVPLSLPLPPTKGIILIHKHMTVLDLALLLGQNPFRFAMDLVEMGAIQRPPTTSESDSVETVQLDFVTISRIARKYGFVAQNAAE
jgi:hypothetical protein